MSKFSYFALQLQFLGPHEEVFVIKAQQTNILASIKKKKMRHVATATIIKVEHCVIAFRHKCRSYVSKCICLDNVYCKLENDIWVW